MIDHYIQLAKSQSASARGGNKTCHLFPEYALLKGGRQSDSAMKNLKSIHAKLDATGVNIAPILEWAEQTDEAGKSSFYVLQKRAQGAELFNNARADDPNFAKNYEQRIESLSAESPKFYEKFVSDWLEIKKAGLLPDPSKSGNFIYAKGDKITFIDLDNFNPKIAERRGGDFHEMLTVLRGGARPWTYEKLTGKNLNLGLATIFVKLSGALTKFGWTPAALDFEIQKNHADVFDVIETNRTER